MKYCYSNWHGSKKILPIVFRVMITINLNCGQSGKKTQLHILGKVQLLMISLPARKTLK